VLGRRGQCSCCGRARTGPGCRSDMSVQGLIVVLAGACVGGAAFMEF
jgi:hypothetical protein